MKPVKPIKIAQVIFRDWCARYGAVVDVEMAAALVRMIAYAIEAERSAGAGQSAGDRTDG